jgi:hypothetical protein
MSIGKQLLDYRSKLRIFVQRFCPILFEVLQLEKPISSGRPFGSIEMVLTSFVVDIYVASTACPVFSIAPDKPSDSFRLNPFRAAPRSA